MIFSMDPGVKHCGCAVWTPSGSLASAWLQINNGSEWWEMAKHVKIGVANYPIHLVLLEQMQIYRRGVAPAKDLLKVQGVVGGVAAVLGAPVKLYLPREWKGTAPKERTVQRIQDALSEEELKKVQLPRAKSLAHNVWDGIGIGLNYFAGEGLRTW